MARPCEPSEAALARANTIVHKDEHWMRTKGMEKVSGEELSKFKLNNASTGKGPAIRAESLDEEGVAQNQALMNHMVSIKSRTYESGSHEPTWLIDVQSTCPQVYGRLAASAIKR